LEGKRVQLCRRLLRFNRASTGSNPLLSSSSQGDAIAGMLLGWGQDGTYGLEWPTATYSKYWGIYVQDDWRVSRNLTLSLGIRYDFDVPRRERFNRPSSRKRAPNSTKRTVAADRRSTSPTGFRLTRPWSC
jgi:outer membrane receptor protein involved in Fe transport